ncbi:MAG: outer membrane beta-barrel protein [Acidiferrobacterales bacterium]
MRIKQGRMFKRYVIASLLFFIVPLSAPLAFAKESQATDTKLKQRRWYVGGSLGASDDKGFNETKVGGKVFGGFRASRYFTAEGALVNLGQFGSGTFGVGSGGEFRKSGLSVQAVGTLPIGQRFQLFGKGGVFFWSVNVREACFTVGSGPVCLEHGRLDDGVDAVYGGGGQYRFSDRWSSRFEWERYKDVGGADVDLFSLGVAYGF